MVAVMKQQHINFLFTTCLSWAIAAGLLLTTGCQMPNNGIPFYLQIDTATVVTAPDEGANTHNITDVWVEAGSDNLGAYGIPINFPVLQKGDVRFLISAGIKESGQSGVRIVYPFYQPDTFTLTAAPEGRYTHTPQFSYKTAAQFPLVDNFEFGSLFDTNLKKVAEDPNGNYCGKITATTDSAVTSVQVGGGMNLPEGQEIWLEVDYRCEIPFYIGFMANYAGSVVRTPVMFVTEKPEWNKLYVKMSQYVGVSQANSYNIYFEALRPFGSPGGSVWIDNVKVVHF